MSVTFTKLFSGLTESTVWVEPYPTRILWVSMLSWADKRGRVFGSIPGIARRAGINMDEAEAAIASFMSPDRHSRTPDHDGRRIEKIDGGWRLLNYGKYRELRDHEDRLEYQREWDRTHRPERYKNPTNPTNPTEIRPAPTQAEAEAEAVKPKPIVGQTPPDGEIAGDSNPNPAPKGGASSGAGELSPRLDKAEKAARREAAVRVLDFLNSKCGRVFQPVDKTLAPIEARLKEGYTEGQCRQVVVRKLDQWADNPRMAPFLRPKTIFGAENFANYVGELVVAKETHDA